MDNRIGGSIWFGALVAYSIMTNSPSFALPPLKSSGYLTNLWLTSLANKSTVQFALFSHCDQLRWVIALMLFTKQSSALPPDPELDQAAKYGLKITRLFCNLTAVSVELLSRHLKIHGTKFKAQSELNLKQKQLSRLIVRDKTFFGDWIEALCRHQCASPWILTSHSSST